MIDQVGKIAITITLVIIWNMFQIILVIIIGMKKLCDLVVWSNSIIS